MIKVNIKNVIRKIKVHRSRSPGFPSAGAGPRPGFSLPQIYGWQAQVEWLGCQAWVPPVLEATSGIPSLGGAHLPHLHQVPSVIARQERINLGEPARASQVQALGVEEPWGDQSQVWEEVEWREDMPSQGGRNVRDHARCQGGHRCSTLGERKSWKLEEPDFVLRLNSKEAPDLLLGLTALLPSENSPCASSDWHQHQGSMAPSARWRGGFRKQGPAWRGLRAEASHFWVLALLIARRFGHALYRGPKIRSSSPSLIGRLRPFPIWGFNLRYSRHHSQEAPEDPGQKEVGVEVSLENLPRQNDSWRSLKRESLLACVETRRCGHVAGRKLALCLKLTLNNHNSSVTY